MTPLPDWESLFHIFKELGLDLKTLTLLKETLFKSNTN